MTSAEFLRLRRLAGLTQEETAQVLGVAHRTVLRWEHGESRIWPLKAQAIRLRLAERIIHPAFGEGEAKATYRG